MSAENENSVYEAPDFEALESPYESELRLGLIESVRKIKLEGVPFAERVPGLNLSYIETAQSVPNCFYVLSAALILQGTKQLMIGGRMYRYGTGSMIITSVDMPTSYELVDVRPSRPFVSLSLRLNPAIIAELLSEQPQAAESCREVFGIERPNRDLLEDFERLLRLLRTPAQLKVRAPMVIRDIHCLALAGNAGQCLRALYAPGAPGQRIRKVIRWLRENFREPVTIKEMAEIASMAPTTLHRHFKEFTSLSPMQYQKRLRLYVAQQFLLRGEGDVNTAAYAVGYKSPQQFNRDYRRLFGVPPGKNIRAQRERLQQVEEQDPSRP